MNIIIFGSGGQAKETIDLIKTNLSGKIVGFVGKYKQIDPIFGIRYLGEDREIDSIIKKYKVTHFFVAIGDINIRNEIYLRVKKKLKPISIISKGANISKFAIIGNHVIIYPGVIINADVKIGNDVLINSNVAIGHETIIGNHININPGVNIAGKAIIEDFCMIGIGASVKENVHIAKNTIIGGGAMVTKDTKSNKTYVGVPARLML